ncbi:hypothetical protein GRX03_10795 [Halovenus sp. WSH3]|uniref:Uncharacterized protein n=1 Tax=Halovenus carboxidivorans TaxID=2692199 RepID=A0A6B0T201_9EURY|nr:DUF5811 family protein [Halovenus carboxidivorans]MXR52084.1 hypothetical protein [Halovenus carboxidivorans]
MYGNTPFGEESSDIELSAEQRKHLRRELSTVADRTRDLLPSEFVVGSELVDGSNGPQATVAVQPPVGGIVSANCSLTDELTIDETQQEDLAVGLAASAALQVKQAQKGERSAVAR